MVRRHLGYGGSDPGAGSFGADAAIAVFRARPATRDCFAQAWLQDSYLMKLKRQTLTFTSNRLKEFLVEQQSRRSEGATKHKVLLRTYQSSPQSPVAGPVLHVPAPE